jgi:hypothetical protein
MAPTSATGVASTTAMAPSSSCTSCTPCQSTPGLIAGITIEAFVLALFLGLGHLLFYCYKGIRYLRRRHG